jgi:hypothetical protein
MKKKTLELIKNLQRQIDEVNSRITNTCFRIGRLEQKVFIPDKKPTDLLLEDSKMKKLMEDHFKMNQAHIKCVTGVDTLYNMDDLRKAFEAGEHAVLAYVDEMGFPVLYNEFPFDNWYEETYIRTRKTNE